VVPFNPQSRIASLERELAWAHLKIQALTEELRRYRVKLLGPRSETLNDLQLELLADEEAGTTLDEVEAEAASPTTRSAPARAPAASGATTSAGESASGRGSSPLRGTNLPAVWRGNRRDWLRCERAVGC
jgi:hypothetical protein